MAKHYTLSGNLPPQIAPTNASEVSMKNWHESNTTLKQLVKQIEKHNIELKKYGFAQSSCSPRYI
jgi:hypothetical protein